MTGLKQKDIELLRDFKKNIDEVVALLQKDFYENARGLFNEKIVTTYFKSEFLKGLLNPFAVFLYEFDDIFNNESYRVFRNFINIKECKYYLLDMYLNDFLTTFNKTIDGA